MSAEIVTIVALTSIALSAVWHLPADAAKEIAIGLGSGLVGYLTKSAVDWAKQTAQRPDKPTITE